MDIFLPDEIELSTVNLSLGLQENPLLFEFGIYFILCINVDITIQINFWKVHIIAYIHYA